MTASRPRAFSLIEVVVAIALFGATATVLLGWLPSLFRETTRNADRLAVQRLPDLVKLELLRRAGPNLDALAGSLPVLDEPAAARSGLLLTATRAGDRLTAQETDGFFGIECWRFADESLRYASERQFLAVAVRVRWPHGVPAAPGGRIEERWFVVALNR